MPTTQLSAPTNVTSQASSDGKSVHVTWQDPNANGSVASYVISFAPIDSKTPAFATETTITAPASGGDVTRAATDKPSVTDLTTKYSAQVVAKAKNSAKNTDSAPGVQGSTTQPAGTLQWEINPSITIKLGDTSLTLTKSSGGGGKSQGRYVLPVSKDDPYKISYDEIKEFASDAGIGSAVPANWPDGKPISGSLNVSKLAVDTDLGLFEMDISVDTQWTPIPGLTIESLGLNLERTDGKTSL